MSKLEVFFMDHAYFSLYNLLIQLYPPLRPPISPARAQGPDPDPEGASSRGRPISYMKFDCSLYLQIYV
jgi:hypothetical protein